MSSKNLGIFLEKFDLKASLAKEFFEQAFIELRGCEIPTRFLLNFLLEKALLEDVLEVKAEKQALNFTYGKDLTLELVQLPINKKLKEGRFYLLTFNKKPLGYVSFQKKGKTLVLKNEMNIGTYLRE